MSLFDTLPQRLDKLQGGDLDDRRELTQEEQIIQQTVNQLRHLLWLCENPQISDFEDIQIYNGWFVGKQFPAQYFDFLPPGYLSRFTQRRDLYNKSDKTLDKDERAKSYIRLIFKEFVAYYATNSVELEELINTINTTQHAKTNQSTE